jgi:hypothetical protein
MESSSKEDVLLNKTTGEKSATAASINIPVINSSADFSIV